MIDLTLLGIWCTRIGRNMVVIFCRQPSQVNLTEKEGMRQCFNRFKCPKRKTFLGNINISWVKLGPPSTLDASHHQDDIAFVGNPNINLSLPLASWAYSRLC